MRTARTRGTARYHTEHHTLLGVAHDADLETIKRAYRQLALEVHPDTNPGDPQAAERFQKLNAAYDALAALAPEPAEEPGEEQDEAVDEGGESTDPRPDSATGLTTVRGPSGPFDPTESPVPGPAARPRHNVFAEPPQPSRPSPAPATPGAGAPPPSGDRARRDDQDADSPSDGPLAGEPPPAQPPVELPLPLADALVRFLVLAPLLWAAAGFPNLLAGDLTVRPINLALCTVITLIGWVGAGALLWSRAPSVPRRVPWWRSPGWDGTPLAVRLLLFYALAGGSSALFLRPHLADEEAPAWTLGLWGGLIAAAWVISGHVPRQMGYESRFQRYWRLSRNSLPPRSERRPRP